MSTTLLNKIEESGVSVLADEPLSRHTTFKIGGAAKYFCTVCNEESLSSLISLLKSENIKYFLLGNGSNILVDDSGFDGAVISLSGEFCNISAAGEHIVCGSGAKLSALCKEALAQSLSGLEFAYGIPGTVGGAIYMNAGAYGGEMKNAVSSVRYLNGNGEICDLSGEKLDFRYRHSAFSGTDNIILSAEFKLSKAESTDISEKMDDLMNRRRQKQPLEYPSAGSVFKRPEGYFAGALIEGAGLKGYRIGGAQVSEKHAGFIINVGDATSADVEALVKHIQDTVFAKNGVMLECEIKKLA